MSLKRIRLSTLMLLVVIAALGITVVVQQRRSARREAELQARIAELEASNMSNQWREMSERRIRRYGLAVDRAIGKANRGGETLPGPGRGAAAVLPAITPGIRG
jgi:uncharacterized protein HemX